MLEFMHMGGFAMWLVLVFGLLTLGIAIVQIVKPRGTREPFFRALSRATLFATLSGLAAGIAATMIRAPAFKEQSGAPDLAPVVMAGLGESLCNAILGFSLLAVAWFIFAFGTRRLDVLRRDN